jgi:peptidoglycan/xylan/chitin deacetylase (PgdA/CDA1 family)
MTSLRTAVKRCAAALLGRSGTSAVLAHLAARRQPLVLGYHSVVEDVRVHAGRAIPANLISRSMLERHLDWVGRRYHFLTLDEMERQAHSGEPWRRPSALVTFDDGYVGVYEQAFPLLKRKGIPAAAFVVTGHLGRSELQIYDRLYLVLRKVLPALRAEPSMLTRVLRDYGVAYEATVALPMEDAFAVMRHLYTTLTQRALRRAIAALETIARVDAGDYHDLRAMTWEMVTALDRNGITIGSHTETHALLTLEEPDTVSRQLSASSAALQQRLGRPVTQFAYPDGRFNPAVVSAVAEAGYRVAFTTCPHRDADRPWLTMPRILLWERSCLDGHGEFSADVMSCHAGRVFSWMAPCAESHRPTAPAHHAESSPARPRVANV